MLKKGTGSKSPTPSAVGPSGNKMAVSPCKVEQGVAEINNQLCSAMFTMVFSEETARQFQAHTQAFGNQCMVSRG